VSAAQGGGTQSHSVYVFDTLGSMLGYFAQPAVHQASGFGLRDLEFDGQSLIGGSEFGISVFDTAGNAVNQILAANGPQPIVQPITGPVASQLAVFRAVALDRSGNGGNGSLLVADFASPIYEIDFAGNVLATFPNQGWSAYGLTIDPVTGNPWVFAGPGGAIEELDRATMAPTGHRLEPIEPGAPGGLALASPVAGHHEPWANRAALVHLVQGTTDHFAVQRLHLHPAQPGWDEVLLEAGRNSGPLGQARVPFWVGDTLDFRLFDPTGQRNGNFAFVLLNVYFDANRDAYTDGSIFGPGTGTLRELRALNPISQPGTPNAIVSVATVGNTFSWSLPVGFPVRQDDLFRAQALVFDPGSPQLSLLATSEINWQADGGERGIVVAAEGATSYHGAAGQPFWTVTSDGTHGHGDITAVELSVIGATGTAALQRFDVDQDGMNDRFDGGNSALAAHQGTYRNGSAALCGLDFQAPGVYVAPFHLAGESSGVAFSTPPDPAGYVQDLRFAFTAFSPGKTFAFDCDTDGGPPSGADHAGLVVRVTTTLSGVLQGVLQVDPSTPGRAVVWFP
ncbi:MAG: hypothetical protein KDC48_03485, partial [Planctomycetes bacterium]|nr:hypothetical protein [Planctomycetota bacterium]